MVLRREWRPMLGCLYCKTPLPKSTQNPAPIWLLEIMAPESFIESNINTLSGAYDHKHEQGPKLSSGDSAHWPGEMAWKSVTDSISWTCPEKQREELERRRRKIRPTIKAARVQLQQFVMTFRETPSNPHGLYTIMTPVRSSSLQMFPSCPHLYQKMRVKQTPSKYASINYELNMYTTK